MISKTVLISSSGGSVSVGTWPATKGITDRSRTGELIIEPRESTP